MICLFFEPFSLLVFFTFVSFPLKHYNTLGKHCLIGAGAVVTKDVPDYALMVGNPAKQIGWVSEAGKRLVFDKDGIAHCKQSGKNYKLDNNNVFEL